ncbi:MAG: helicase-exonuclease AddAB subunit AddB [Lachnospiraceae bacterium]|nr:helicase-exonuclease AddAB subunit AddB [Lachnospiraceae bacterium]
MSLRFYFGASGAGKSTSLHKEIVGRAMAEPDTNFFVIVPDQFTMQTQMDLVKAHPSRGIMNIDVLSFGRLSHRILEEVGANARLVLDDTGKSLILRKVAEGVREELPVIGSNLNKIGYIHEVKSAISEFMQYGIGPKELEELTEYAKRRSALHCKLKDLGVLYRHFLGFIRDKYVTTEELLELLCRVLPQSRLIRDSVVAFDGFTGFTPIQNRLIQRLMELAREVIVTVVMDSGERNPYVPDGEQKLFYLSKRTAAALKGLAAESGTALEKAVFLPEEAKKELPRFAGSPQLQHLESHLFRYPLQAYEGEGEAIHLMEASSPGEEIRQIFIRMKELVRREGYCYRDMAVVTGDLETYAGHIEAEAERFEIPVFLDRTTGIRLNPFIEYIRSALKLIREDFSYRSVFHYLRSGLTGFDREDTDRLENYVLATGIDRKRKWLSVFTGPADLGEEELSRLNELRCRLLEQLSPLMERNGGTAGERIRMLYRFITGNRVQEKLAAYERMFEAENQPARAREYGQIYRLVMDLLDQMDALLSEEKVSPREFADILDAGFEEIQVGTIPQNVDRVVVGDIERTRLKEIKALFFVGINDGSIPKSAGSGGIISDIDREFLQESPYELAPGPRQQMYIQRLYLYLNMTKPSRHLCLSYCKVNNEGKSVRPAYLIDTIHKLFPGIRTEKPELRGFEEQIKTKQSGLGYLTDMLRSYAAGVMEEGVKKRFFTLYHIYREDPDFAPVVGRLKEAAFCRYRESPLGKEIAGLLYGSLLAGSVSRLEKYASCAYAHFLQYGLALKEREEYGFEAVDMGNVFHGVLDLFAGKLEESGHTWFDFGEEAADRLLGEALDAYAAAYGQTVLYSTARNEYAIERMRRILKRAVMTLQYQLKKGMFLPEKFELSFSMAQGPEEVDIALSGEERMRLQGRIDRIDTYEDERHVYVKIIDYKSGNRRFDLAAVYYGLELQLVAYMNVALQLEKRMHPGKEIVPAAMLYYHVTDPMVKAEEELTPEEIRERLLKELRMAGTVNKDDAVIRLLDKEFTDRSDVVPVERKKDGSCSARSSVLTEEELRAVSAYVSRKMRRIGLDILEGNMAVNPCRQGNSSACDYCAFSRVCGFDGRIEGYHYRNLEALGPEEALERMREEQD